MTNNAQETLLIPESAQKIVRVPNFQSFLEKKLNNPYSAEREAYMVKNAQAMHELLDSKHPGEQYQHIGIVVESAIENPDKLAPGEAPVLLIKKHYLHVGVRTDKGSEAFTLDQSIADVYLGPEFEDKMEVKKAALMIKPYEQLRMKDIRQRRKGEKLVPLDDLHRIKVPRVIMGHAVMVMTALANQNYDTYGNSIHLFNKDIPFAQTLEFSLYTIQEAFDDAEQIEFKPEQHIPAQIL